MFSVQFLAMDWKGVVGESKLSCAGILLVAEQGIQDSDCLENSAWQIWGPACGLDQRYCCLVGNIIT